MSSQRLLTLMSAAILLAEVICPRGSAAERPNIILFLVDDMGWMDCGVYGSQYYETPHIDHFAKQSMRFTQAYAQPLCSPTRACILSGQSAARHGITAPACHTPPRPHPANPPISRNYFDPEQFTLAEALREAGYRTGHFGKWHLGWSKSIGPKRRDLMWRSTRSPVRGLPGNISRPTASIRQEWTSPA